MKSLVFLSFVITLCLSAQATAMQTEPAESPQEPTAADATAADKGLAPPADYVIGPDDVLGVLFWREPSMSGDVAVRPDGKITLPLLNEVQAAGLTPPELRAVLTKEAGRFLETPNVTIVAVTQRGSGRRSHSPGTAGCPHKGSRAIPRDAKRDDCCP